MESTTVAGFSEDEALECLKRLLRCGYEVRWVKRDGSASRYELLLASDYVPGLSRRLRWRSQVEQACAARRHLPLSIAPLGPACFSARAAVVGQAVLPGVR